MIETMTKDTFSKASMLFDLQRLDPYQPVPGAISPTEAERHQGNQLSQFFFIRDMRRFQTKASGLQTTEQSFNAPSPAIISKQPFALFGAGDNDILTVGSSQPHDKQPLPQDVARPRKQHPRACFLCAE